jgi:hypothetical protein
MSVRGSVCLLAVVLPGLLAQVARGADIYTVANGATSTINELGVCRKVTNNHASGLSLMVPTGSASEWYTGGNSFIEHTPPGVSLAACCLGANQICSSGPECCSGTCVGSRCF